MCSINSFNWSLTADVGSLTQPWLLSSRFARQSWYSVSQRKRSCAISCLFGEYSSITHPLLSGLNDDYRHRCGMNTTNRPDTYIVILLFNYNPLLKRFHRAITKNYNYQRPFILNASDFIISCRYPDRKKRILTLYFIRLADAFSRYRETTIHKISD